MKKLWLALGLWLCAVPAQAQSPIYPIITTASVVVSTSTATTTKLIAGKSGQRIYITAISVDAAGSNTVTFEYGTGTNCGTGTTTVSGPYTLTNGAPMHFGSGAAPLNIMPPGTDFCVVTSAAIVLGGFISYAQF